MAKLVEITEQKVATGVKIELTIEELATITEAIGQTNAHTIKEQHYGFGDIEGKDLLNENKYLYSFLIETYKGAKKQ